jgi:hypothetical protein
MTFYEYLQDRARDRRQFERMGAYLHEWDFLSDSLGRAPSAIDYSQKWQVSLATAYRLAAEFRELFPTEETPERLLRLLWDGVRGSSIRAVFGVKVVQEFEPQRSR